MAIMSRDLTSFCSLLVLTVALAMSASPLDAGPITTADGDGADAMIRAGTFKEDNFQGTMAVKDSFTVLPGPNFTRKAYFRFDLTPITLPLTDVSFNLTVVDFAPGNDPTGVDHVVNVWALDDGVAGEDWGELTITWNNAPGNDVTSGSNMIDSTFLGTFALFESTTSTGDIVQFSSPSLLNAVNSDTNNLLTLMLTDATQIESGFGYYSSENAPELYPSLSFAESTAAVPEPGSLALLVSGGIGLLAYRARRRRKKEATQGVSKRSGDAPAFDA